MHEIYNFLLHLDQWLEYVANIHPVAAYCLFFVVVFTESAFFPAAPFLPGDGLLFAVGVVAADGGVNLWLSLFILAAGGILGNMTAYRLGLNVGETIFERISWIKRDHYLRAHQFYQKYGKSALILSRFIPVIRALMPFLAGIVVMNRRDFALYNILSVALWVSLIVLVAYALGHLPAVQQHFLWVVMAMAGLSFLPVVIVGVRSGLLRRPRREG